MVSWDIIAWGVIWKKMNQSPLVNYVSIHSYKHAYIQPTFFWEQKKKGEGEERLLHPNTASHMLQSTILPLTCASIPLKVSSQSCPDPAEPLYCAPPLFPEPSQLLQPHQTFVLSRYPQFSSLRSWPSLTLLPQASLVLLASLPVLLPGCLEDRAVVPSLSCCSLTRLPRLVESPGLSLGGLTDPV